MNQDDKKSGEDKSIQIPLPVLRVIKKSWDDPDFKRRLLADPIAVLKAEGVSVPEGAKVRVIEDSPKRLHLVLPNDQAAKALTGDSRRAKGASIMYS